MTMKRLVLDGSMKSADVSNAIKAFLSSNKALLHNTYDATIVVDINHKIASETSRRNGKMANTKALTALLSVEGAQKQLSGEAFDFDFATGIFVWEGRTQHLAPKEQLFLYQYCILGMAIKEIPQGAQTLFVLRMKLDADLLEKMPNGTK